MPTRARTTTAKQPARRRGHAGPARAPKSSADYVQQAMQDIDKARERVSVELRENLDAALERLRDAAGDLRKRAEQQTGDWGDALEQATEDVRRDLGRRAVMAQRTPAALKEMSAAVRERRAQLTAERSAKKPGAS